MNSAAERSSVRFGSSAHTCTPRRDGGQQHPDHRPDHRALPDPVAPAIGTWSRPPQPPRRPSSHRPTVGRLGPPRPVSARRRSGRPGCGADQLQHHHPGTTARMRPAGRRTRAQGLRPRLEVHQVPTRSPTGPHQVHRPGPVHRARHRDPAGGSRRGPARVIAAFPAAGEPPRGRSHTGPATNRANHDSCSTRSPAAR